MKNNTFMYHNISKSLKINKIKLILEKVYNRSMAGIHRVNQLHIPQNKLKYYGKDR